MANFSLDTIQTILGFIESPLERQHAVAGLARSNRFLNGHFTGELYSSPILATTRAASKFARTYSGLLTPWARMEPRRKVVMPRGLTITQTDRMKPCTCEERPTWSPCRCGVCPRCSTSHLPLHSFLFTVVSNLFDTLTELVLENCFVPAELFAQLLEEGAPLRRRISRLEVRNACDIDDDTMGWIFWLYRNSEYLKFYEGWHPDNVQPAYKEAHELVAILSAKGLEVVDHSGARVEGIEGRLVKLMLEDFYIWRDLSREVFEDVDYITRWTDVLSPTLAFSALRRLAVPLFNESLVIPVFMGSGCFPGLTHLTFTANPTHGDNALEVGTLDIRMMRRSVTRSFPNEVKPEPHGTLVAPRNAADWPVAVDPIRPRILGGWWKPLSTQELEKLMRKDPPYRGPELELLDLSLVDVCEW